MMGARPTGEPSKSTGWERAAAAAAIGLTVLMLWPKLPPGICYGDSGDLQLASSVLGIMHPPGYPGYVSLGFLATQLPGLEPARAVSVLFFLAVPATVLLLILTQVRLGVDAWLGAAVALGFLLHPHVRESLLAPEVYLPSLALCAATVYGVIRFADDGSTRWLLGAAGAFGVVMANRPPAVLIAPGILIAVALAIRSRKRQCAEPDASSDECGNPAESNVGRAIPPFKASRSTWVAAGVVGLLVGPMVYSIGYVWVRDTPNTAYNYIDHFAREYESLPAVSEGLEAKGERAVWLLTGRQFASNVRTDWRGIRSRLRVLPGFVFTDRPTRWIVGLLVAGGVVACRRRHRPACVCLLGMSAAAVAYFCFYRVYGQAADLLGLLYSITVMCGVVGSSLAPRDSHAWRRWVGPCAFGFSSVVFVQTIGSHAGWNADATRLVDRANLEGLPTGSIVLANWDAFTPLAYEASVRLARDDIEVFNATPAAWRRLAAERPNRPIFAVRRVGVWGSGQWVRRGSLWQWAPDAASTVPAH